MTTTTKCPKCEGLTTEFMVNKFGKCWECSEFAQNEKPAEQVTLPGAGKPPATTSPLDEVFEFVAVTLRAEIKRIRFANMRLLANGTHAQISRYIQHRLREQFNPRKENGGDR